jgi:hypothetical protein
VDDTIDVLGRLDLPHEAVVSAIGPTHAFFQPNGLELEARRRGLAWKFPWSNPLDPDHLADAPSSIPAGPVDVVLLRVGGPTRVEMAMLASALPALFDRDRRRFRPAGRPLALGDGSVVHVFASGAAPWTVESQFPHRVEFKPDGTSRIEAHPGRASSARPTRLTLTREAAGRGSLWSTLKFSDPRCVGVSVGATFSGPDGSWREEIGSFSPGSTDARIASAAAGRPWDQVSIEVASSLTEPENVDYCSVVLDELRVSGDR